MSVPSLSVCLSHTHVIINKWAGNREGPNLAITTKSKEKFTTKSKGHSKVGDYKQLELVIA